MEMKPICTTNFYENSFNHEILAVAFEDGRAVATIRNLEISKLTGVEALEIARNGWPVSMLCANGFNNFLRPGGIGNLLDLTTA